MSNFSWAILFLLALVNSHVLEFEPDTMAKPILKDFLPALFVLGEADQRFQDIKTVFKQYDELLKETSQALFFIYLDDQSRYYQKLTMILGVNVLPSPVIIFSAHKKKYLFEGILNLNNLKEFVERAQEGQLQRFYKSDPEPLDTNNDLVKIIVGKTFESTVLKSSKQFFIMLHAQWCGHCHKTLPKFQKAAELLKNNPNIIFAKIDATKNEVQSIVVRSFPTFYLWKKDKTLQPVLFSGERHTESFIKFLKNNTEHEWIDTQNPSSFQQTNSIEHSEEQNPQQL